MLTKEKISGPPTSLVLGLSIFSTIYDRKEEYLMWVTPQFYIQLEATFWNMNSSVWAAQAVRKKWI